MSALLINANALNIPLADKSVQCVVTSPPYYGLRDYGVGGQIGLEVTPDEYIANLVAVFREVKRVLKDDGTLWVNIGDSSAMSFNKKSGELKSKDLIGIPWMLAFALRADGWYLRQDIIWAKPNPMPESVKDRCTKSHEYIFLLSKSAKYYYDNEAVMEDAAGGRERFGGAKYGDKGLDKSRNDTARFDETIVSVRNKRSVWTVPTRPYKGAHYATFPPDLIKPCILAGAPEGGIVFDPFVGSGTTVATAVKLGRRGVGLDLSMKYLRENARERIYQEEMQPVLCTREEVM